MTQVAASQGSLKLLFKGGAPAGPAATFGSGFRDPFCCSSELKSAAHLQKLGLGLCSSSPSLARSQLFFRLSTQYRASSQGLLHEYDYDSDAEEDELACFRALVLDISYRPVNVVCWRRAICLEFTEKVDVLEYYDQTVNSPSGSFYIPAVLRVPHLLQVVKRRRIVHNLTKKNILHRDKYSCQYCSSSDNLTIDHVLPVAQGGKWEWENLVTACSKCNSRKGQKPLDEANMKLMRVPKAPKDYDILAIPLTSAAIKMLRLTKTTPEEWHQYLSKPSL
ncbi:hypothetical protein SAY87_017641 [Trapa incisa]|uniref:HNH nuclease domain-containing protein n=1 Tax=Trapa incisa TaxID=236973 RepID=A0AAN7QS25_9MYRT|nr:hypothetical protein SAY87_017641 [Trapa incisa]